MRVDRLIELLEEFPGYWEVKVGGQFVTDVHEAMHVVDGEGTLTKHFLAGKSPTEVGVVVVIG